MGNCVSGSFAGGHKLVKVATSNGGIMELDAPVTVECITTEFPGQAIFRGGDGFSGRPLPHNEELHPGELYYLLPLMPHQGCKSREEGVVTDGVVAPYRMSFDDEGIWKRIETEVFSRCNTSSKKGIWKVKLAINPDKLAEILSQEARTEELIENVRTVAKCRHGSSSSLSSDEWSLASSSRKGSCLETSA